MPLQNRVTPLGDLIAVADRGLVYGNSGCLHDDRRQIRRRYATRRWIACQLEFRGRHRAKLMTPGRYTELFFLDEATALAAGHRPCAECRRSDYNRLTELWSELHGGVSGADAIDAQLHRERLDDRTGGRRLHPMSFRDLPVGTFVLHVGQPWLVLPSRLARWSPGGYLEARSRPEGGQASVITPPSLVALLNARPMSLVPLVHPSAPACELTA